MAFAHLTMTLVCFRTVCCEQILQAFNKHPNTIEIIARVLACMVRVGCIDHTQTIRCWRCAHTVCVRFSDAIHSTECARISVSSNTEICLVLYVTHYCTTRLMCGRADSMDMCRVSSWIVIQLCGFVGRAE